MQSKIACVFTAALLLVSCSPQHTPNLILATKVIERTSLPKSCERFLRSDHGEWNPLTEMYAPNEEWEKCMGVGRLRR